jgi:hypothetical protein
MQPLLQLIALLTFGIEFEYFSDIDPNIYHARTEASLSNSVPMKKEVDLHDHTH